MNVAVMKSKAEQAFRDIYSEAASRLPGNGTINKLRSEALARFDAVGLPHRRIEEWKYTDLRSLLKEIYPLASAAAGTSEKDVLSALGPLATVDAYRVVFVDGVYQADLSSADGVSGVTVESLADILASADASKVANDWNVEQADAVTALNTAFMTDGAVIDIEDGAELDKPLMTIFVRRAGEARMSAVRNLVQVGEKATATLVEVFVATSDAAADAQSHGYSQVRVGQGAKLDHIKVAHDRGQNVHLNQLESQLAEGAEYRVFQYTDGQQLARNNINVLYAGEDGMLDLSGAFLGRASQHIDTTLVVDHAVPQCESRELFKGVLDNRARGIFQGKVIVRPDAQKTDGKQMAQALMLSPDCEFDSKPELEIYADDVVCGHGSTSAELDDDLMFYMRSRGIPEAEARALMIESFIGEALEKIRHDALRDAVGELAKAWLDNSSI